MSKQKADKPPVATRLVLATQGRGGIGKSTAAEGLISSLTYAGIPFAAIDSDPLHHTLSNRYPTIVDRFDATASMNNFHVLIRKLPDVPVVVLDIPAQATDFLLNAFAHFSVLDSFDQRGIRVTILIFASDESASIEAAAATVEYFGDRVDYLLVENPANFATDMFRKTPLAKWFAERKTPTIRIPSVSAITIQDWKTLERKKEKYIPLAEAATHPDLYDTVRNELQYLRDRFLAQFEECAVPRLIADASLIKNKVARSEVLNGVPHAATLKSPWL